MPRKEQIEAAAKNVFPNQGHTFNHELAFIQGAQWADANPETLGMREYRRLETKIVTYEAFRAETDEIIMKLQAKLTIAVKALEMMQAGFGGMFGNQKLTYEQEALQMGPEIINEALAKIEDMKGEK